MRHASVTVEVTPGETTRVAIISDTHSHPHPDAVRHLRGLAPHRILHGGDVGDPEVLGRFAQIAPVIAVRGNIDGLGLPDAVDVHFTARGERLFALLLTHIAVHGVKIRADAARLARAHGADLIVCGHSHVPLRLRDRGLTLFNPGSIGPRRFSLPITFGLLELTPDQRVTLRHIDCETGEEWLPPPTAT
jgi:putative phosphoesterase